MSEREKIMLIAGGSDVAGSEIDGTDDSYYNRDHSFGNLLATRLGYRPLNIAITGATNSSIMRSIVEWFHTQYNAETMDVFVLIGWTESTRMEIPWTKPTAWDAYNKYANWFSNSAVDYLRVNASWKGTYEEEQVAIAECHKIMARYGNVLELQSANFILTIQFLLKSMKIPYVMCNTLHMFSPLTVATRHLKFYLTKFDKKRYISYMDNGESFFTKYKNLGYTNPNAKYWHHGEEPHELYAKVLYKFIEDQKCLSLDG